MHANDFLQGLFAVCEYVAIERGFDLPGQFLNQTLRLFSAFSPSGQPHVDLAGFGEDGRFGVLVLLIDRSNARVEHRFEQAGCAIDATRQSHAARQLSQPFEARIPKHGLQFRRRTR